MEIEKKEINGVLIAGLSGRLDGENPSHFKDRLHRYIELNPNVILDCTKLSYLDSSGLGALLSCLRKAIAKGGDMKLACLGLEALMVLELTRTQEVFSIFGSVPGALTSFKMDKTYDRNPG